MPGRNRIVEPTTVAYGDLWHGHGVGDEGRGFVFVGAAEDAGDTAEGAAACSEESLVSLGVSKEVNCNLLSYKKVKVQ